MTPPTRPTPEQAATIRATADIIMNQRIESAPVIQDLFASNPASQRDAEDAKRTQRDWPDDFVHDNGRYLCTCCSCHQRFTGHKRRSVCRVCAAADQAAAKERGQWLAEHKAPANWTILTLDEVRQWYSESADLLLQLNVERKLRRELAEALSRITTAAAKSPPVAGLHYALKDGTEMVEESRQLDAEIAAREAKRRESGS